MFESRSDDTNGKIAEKPSLRKNTQTQSASILCVYLAMRVTSHGNEVFKISRPLLFFPFFLKFSCNVSASVPGCKPSSRLILIKPNKTWPNQISQVKVDLVIVSLGSIHFYDKCTYLPVGIRTNKPSYCERHNNNILLPHARK